MIKFRLFFPQNICTSVYLVCTYDKGYYAREVSEV